MLNAGNIVMLMTFVNIKSQTLIFSNTLESLRDTAEFIKSNDCIIEQVKVYDIERQRFKRVKKDLVRTWCDHCVEIDLIFEEQL